MTDELIPIQIIENKIFIIRGQKVMLDRDLAELYEVPTFRLNEAVKRNKKRFPPEFMFQLSDNEKNELIAICDKLKTLKYSPSNPYAFTEHGVVMLASILNSERAIVINVQIVKAFIKLREMALTHAEFSKQLKELEATFINYAKQNNADVEEIFQQLAYLHDITKPKQIGFKTED